MEMKIVELIHFFGLLAICHSSNHNPPQIVNAEYGTLKELMEKHDGAVLVYDLGDTSPIYAHGFEDSFYDGPIVALRGCNKYAKLHLLSLMSSQTGRTFLEFFTTSDIFDTYKLGRKLDDACISAHHQSLLSNFGNFGCIYYGKTECEMQLGEANILFKNAYIGQLFIHKRIFQSIQKHQSPPEYVNEYDQLLFLIECIDSNEIKNLRILEYVLNTTMPLNYLAAFFKLVKGKGKKYFAAALLGEEIYQNEEALKVFKKFFSRSKSTRKLLKEIKRLAQPPLDKDNAVPLKALRAHFKERCLRALKKESYYNFYSKVISSLKY